MPSNWPRCFVCSATRRSTQGACTIPFRERGVRPIVYHLSKNFPADLVPDAQLAALAIEFGLTLQTTDRDFARFSGLMWENPLAA